MSEPEPKVVLITGASSGIGRATAKLLAARGHRVFGTSRHPAADTLDGFALLPLEVTSDGSAAACVKAVADRTGGRVDVLLNNVGTGILGAAEESDAGEVARLFDVNFLGAVRMTNAVLPLMRARKAGKVLVMSSSGGVASVPFSAYYCATKHALEGWAEALRNEVRPLGVAVAVVAPGPVSTPAGEKAWRPARAIPDYAEPRDRLTAEFVRSIREGMDPGRVAETIRGIVEGGWPKPRYRVGASSWGVSLARGVLPAGVFDFLTRKAVGSG
ncbi:MAG: SDR family NAD(P)-dependent oxidoreductase [Gemmataceae bacterium]|nr:SDR family NAD(P)-dependent oxidoreductase [Gemmataceae bacterium]